MQKLGLTIRNMVKVGQILLFLKTRRKDIKLLDSKKKALTKDRCVSTKLSISNIVEKFLSK